ncbi:helix-turn-helix domain-containing protein [Actinokineospora sp. NPDC004072]
MTRVVRRKPHARARMLGAQLRAMRMRAGLSLERAAQLAQISLSSMSRTENGLRRISSEDVAGLLGLYRVPVRLRTAIIAMARFDEQAGWWHPELDADLATADALDTYARDAHTVTEWVITCVPPLLQTQAYALARMHAEGLTDSAAAVRWHRQRQKQELLRRVDHTAFIHEFALRTPYGGTAILSEQLRHLIAAPDRGVGIRLVPAGAPLSALTHSWLMLDFPKDPPIVYLELHHSSVYLHEPTAHHYTRQREQLRRTARTVADTRKLLQAFIGQV